jgi:hypothetical protein
MHWVSSETYEGGMKERWRCSLLFYFNKLSHQCILSIPTFFLLLLGPWTAALFSIRRKRLYESELEKLANFKLTLKSSMLNLVTIVLDADIIHPLPKLLD